MHEPVPRCALLLDDCTDLRRGRFQAWLLEVFTRRLKQVTNARKIGAINVLESAFSEAAVVIICWVCLQRKKKGGGAGVYTLALGTEIFKRGAHDSGYAHI